MCSDTTPSLSSELRTPKWFLWGEETACAYLLKESQTSSTKKRTCATVFNCHVRHVCCNKNLFIVQNYHRDAMAAQRRGGGGGGCSTMFCAVAFSRHAAAVVKSIFSKPWACCYLRKFEVKIMADDPMAVNRCWLQILEFSTSDEFPLYLSLPLRVL